MYSAYFVVCILYTGNTHYSIYIYTQRKGNIAKIPKKEYNIVFSYKIKHKTLSICDMSFVFTHVKKKQTLFDIPVSRRSAWFKRLPGRISRRPWGLRAGTRAESKFLKNLARGQEGGSQDKLPGAYSIVGFLKIAIHPRLRAYLAPAPTPFHSKVHPGMKLRTGSRTECFLVLKIEKNIIFKQSKLHKITTINNNVNLSKKISPKLFFTFVSGKFKG